MMRDVVISMHSIEGCDTDDQGIVDFSTDGHYFKDGDTSCFSYLETDVTGLEGTRTSVIVRPDEVVVDRDGMITGRMIFREREKNSFLYSTPYGTATLGVSTKKYGTASMTAAASLRWTMCWIWSTRSSPETSSSSALRSRRN